MTLAEGGLQEDMQQENSVCLNSAKLQFLDGRRMLKRLASHYYLLMTGHWQDVIAMIKKVFSCECVPL